MMKLRPIVLYVLGVAAVCGAVVLIVNYRRAQQQDEDARRSPEQAIRAPAPSAAPSNVPPGQPPIAGPGGALPPNGPPSSAPLPFGRGLAPLPPTIGRPTTGGPPFAGGVRTEAVVDLNTAPESALITLPGITPEYAKAIVAHRPYRDKPDLEQKTGLPHAVVDRLGPPAMIRSTSVEPFPQPKKKG